MTDTATLLSEWKKYRDENPLQRPSKVQPRKFTVATGALPLGDIKGKNEDEDLKEQMHQKYAEQQRIAREATLKEWKKYRDENPLQRIEKPEWMKTPEGIEAQVRKQVYEKYGPLKPVDAKKVEDIIAKGVTSPPATQGVTSPPLNTQKAQAQASKETDIKEIERQIVELKKAEQSGITQIPIKTIAIAGAALIGVIMVVILILRGNRDSPSSS